MGKWQTKLYKTDRARDFDHERDRQVRARQVYETIDRQPFQWMVVVVAGIGFFLDGYTLFATNIALPMIAYVYWNTEVSHSRITAINTATLAGTIFGQIVFGLFADSKGRKRMYGVELIILIISTFGVVMSSVGQHNSMSIFGWLITWRLIAGIGVGADYPLSAIITSEFAPTAQRARMMASVFFMQPLGQIASNIVALIVIVMTRRILGEEDLVRSVDIMWRWIIGTGVVPAVLAIILRMTIPETPRFTLEIEDDPVKAEFDATNLFGEMGDDEDLIFPASKELEQGTWMLDNTATTSINKPAPSISSIPSTSHTLYNDEGYEFNSDHPRSSSALSNADWTHTSQALPTLNSKWSLTRADIFQYFIRERNVLTLIGTSFAWLLLDFCFYGIGLSSPHFLAKTWGTLNIHGRRPPWQISDDPTVSVYTQFLDTTVHSIVILNLGSVVGALLLVLTINRLNRVTLQRYSFLFLAAIFIAMGVTFLTSDHQAGPIAIVLYVVAQTAFNFGPNATTYILPSELFPTRYRATCHGISAATGKVGSILMQLVDKAVAHNMIKKLHSEYPAGHIDPQLFRDMRASRYAHTLLGYSAAMVLGFVFSMLIPHVQSRIERKDEGGNVFVRAGRWVRGLGRRRWKSKTLEELSLGRAGEKSASVARARRTVW